MPATAPRRVAPRQKMPSTSAGTKVEAASENEAETSGRMSAGLSAATIAAMRATESSANFDRMTRCSGAIRRAVSWLYRSRDQRIADGQQQAVGRRQRRGQPACGDERRHHVRQAADLGRGQHDDVRAQAQLAELQEAVAVDVAHRDQRRVDPGPLGDPGRQRVEAAAHQVLHHLELHQHGQRGHAQVQQRDEEQRPGHRFARLRHAGASCRSA